MKKLLAVIFALILSASAVCAETVDTIRTRTIELDGEVFEISETLYASEAFGLWYPADVVEKGTYYEHTCFRPIGAEEEDMTTSYLVVPVEITPDQADAMMLEAVGGYEPEWVIGMQREFVTDAGNSVLSIDANNGEEIHRYYLIVGEAYSLCITAIYPAALADVWTRHFDVMTGTIEF